MDFDEEPVGKTRIGTILFNNAILFLGLNLVFWLVARLVIYFYNRNYDQLIKGSISYPISSNATKTGMNCYSCDLDYYIRSGTSYQFSFFAIALAIGVALSFGLFILLKKKDLIRNHNIRMLLSSNLWYVAITSLAIYIAFLDITSGTSMVNEANDPNFWSRVNWFIVGMTTLFIFLGTNVSIYRTGELNNSANVFKSAQKIVPISFVFYFIMVHLYNLPYYPHQLLSSWIQRGMYDGTPLVNDTLRLNFLSGLLILSLYIVIPHLILGISALFVEQGELRIEYVKEVRTHSVVFTIIAYVLGMLFILWGIYSNYYFKSYLLNPTSSNLFRKLPNGMYNPYFIDFRYINQPPSNDHNFGTDFIGRDIYSRTIFGLGHLIVYSIYISVGRIAISVIFYFAKGVMPSQVHNRIYDLFKNIPRLLVLTAMGILLISDFNVLIWNNHDYSFAGVGSFILVTMLLFWGDTYQILEQETSKEFANPWIARVNLTVKLLLATMAMVIVELTLVTMLVGGGNFNLFIGQNFINSLYNYPSKYTWAWQYPLLVVLLTYSFLSLLAAMIQIRYRKEDDSLYPQNDLDKVAK